MLSLLFNLSLELIVNKTDYNGITQFIKLTTRGHTTTNETKQTTYTRQKGDGNAETHYPPISFPPVERNNQIGFDYFNIV